MLGIQSKIGWPRKATAAAVAFSAVMALSLPTAAVAQAGGAQSGPQRVDSVVVEGNQRVAANDVMALFGVVPGTDVTFRDIQVGMKALLSQGQFKDVEVRARGAGTGVTLVLVVDEQPLVRRVTVVGLEHLSDRQVRDTTGLRAGLPFSPQRVLDAKAFIRSELAAKGIPFASIEERLDPVPDRENEVDLTLDVAEGQRVTVAQVDFLGNEGLEADVLRNAMSTRAEGFWWFRSGSFDDTRFQTDLAERVPSAYRANGFLDAQVVSDTLIIDPQTGKARVEVTVNEGPQYRLGAFDIEGNTRFTDEELERYFRRSEGGLLSSLGIGGSQERGQEGDVFDAEAFTDAMITARERYANEGYIYAQINPVITRNETPEGGTPTVDVSWQVREGTPAIVNRVSIVGNEYTYEWVVRDRIFILPGDVYSQDRVLRSYQSISSLGFFEAPMAPPDIVPLENGDVDITFNVKEKQTGSINFGTSVGGGVGLSGFIGYEQPNLFGQAKSGTLRWDFGRYLNSFELAYSDPALLQSQISGSLSLFNSRDRFFQFATGRRKRLGANTRFGIPWPDSRVTRIFAGYGISRTKYEQFDDVDDTSLFGRPPGVQSQFSVGVTRQTLDHPLFPTSGSKQSINLEANGGLLGGDGNFTKMMLEGTWYVPVGSLGDPSAGGRPVRFALGLSMKAGAVFGDAAAFPFDRFWMGGVQFGQPLRGYDETSITPQGYFPERSGDIFDIDRLGNAFFSMTAEYALRLNDQISMATFFDAGNVWRAPRNIDPTKLYRGAGFGLQLVTPFGPIGLDYAYGFDKTTPGWQLHFRMGPGF
ncbi:MAG TPA: outer membrane protein assembly factor BamA [Longimicrobiales bacterium]|nr:outer membrane protein assembly factor BamA [Longimicrobiales bacterium]